MPIYGICTAFLSREAAIFYRLLAKVGNDVIKGGEGRDMLYPLHHRYCGADVPMA
jgi:hypothetical protein